MKFLGPPQSGSIAASTSSHNRAGQYTRNRRSPVQPVGTGRRAAVRAVFAGQSAGWSGLTDAQRASWSSFADSHPITDALGQSIKLTGHQMYVRVNSSAVNVGLAPLTVPPGVLDPGTLSAIVPAFSVATGISIAYSDTQAAAMIAVGLSRPMSAGRGFNKTFWQPPGTDGYTDGASSPFILTTAKYSAQFGAPVIGQRVFFRLTPVSSDGFNGPPVIVSCIVAA